MASNCRFDSGLAMQGHPIHLWDALSGELRASYRVYNAADEVTAACSIAFDEQGHRLFAGLNNRLCIFDVARPGRYYKNIVPHSRASPGLQGLPLMWRDGHVPHFALQAFCRHVGWNFMCCCMLDVPNESGLQLELEQHIPISCRWQVNTFTPAAGIISCMACNPDRSAMLAAGSYLGDTGIFEERSGDLLYVLQGQRGGITQAGPRSARAVLGAYCADHEMQSSL